MTQRNKRGAPLNSSGTPEKKNFFAKIKISGGFRNFLLALGYGCGSFLGVWTVVYVLDFNCPTSLKYQISKSEWDFWLRLIISTGLTIIILLIANSVVEEKKKFTNGIGKSVLLIFLLIILWQYGINKPSREPQLKRTEAFDELDNGKNPFEDLDPTYTFTLNKNEESLWVDFPANCKMGTFGSKGNYQIIYKNGSVVNIEPGKLLKLPKLEGATKIKIKSNQDKQKIYVYMIKK